MEMNHERCFWTAGSLSTSSAAVAAGDPATAPTTQPDSTLVLSSPSITNTPTVFNYDSAGLFEATPTSTTSEGHASATHPPAAHEFIADSSAQPASAGDAKPEKRRRGRPRKHPLGSPAAASRQPKVRVKTGCLVCRRRKKKCDEARPICNNCLKYNGGSCHYDDESGGKEKRKQPPPSPNPSVSPSRDQAALPRLGDLDHCPRISDADLLDYFKANICPTLGLHGKDNQMVKEVLLCAKQNTGLMHSLLCLSATHAIAQEHTFEKRALSGRLTPSPAVANLAWSTNYPVLISKMFHLAYACKYLKEDINSRNFTHGSQHSRDAIILVRILILMSQSMNDHWTGDSNRKDHVRAASRLVSSNTIQNSLLSQLINAFLIYFPTSVTNALESPQASLPGPFQIPPFMQSEAGTYLRTANPVFSHLSRISIIRDHLRVRRALSKSRIVDRAISDDISDIKTQLEQWQYEGEINSPHHILSLLYHKATCCYLYRTMSCASVQHPKIFEIAQKAITHLLVLKTDDTMRSKCLTPVFLLGLSTSLREQWTVIDDAFKWLQGQEHDSRITQAWSAITSFWEHMATHHDKSNWEALIGSVGLEYDDYDVDPT